MASALDLNSGVTDLSLPSPNNLIHRYFERQADLIPHSPALECNGDVLSYWELEQRANQIAHYLRIFGVAPKTLVGISLSKSVDLFAAILGVLKAGCGYVPVDPKTPADRLAYIANDAHFAAVLTNVPAPDSGVALACPVLRMDDLRRPLQECPTERPATPTLADDDICYVIYTSGSTGRPKGVALEHRNVANFVESLGSIYGVTEQDRVYQGFSVAFDASVEEIWAAFALGGTLVVPSDDVARSPDMVADFINANKVTYFSTVPSFLSLIADDLPSVRLIIVGGESCPASLVSKWASKPRLMLNTYGPTEATVVATLAKCIPDEPVSIGWPLPGYVCHVVDEDNHEVSAGQVGELLIGGKSVARGYLNLPDLTEKQFVTNHFDSKDTAPRLYRTRDLVRVRPDGSLEFVGRCDDQVKIRGYRIELAEIESVLLEHPSIRNAVVVVHHRSEEIKEVAAYVIGAGAFDTLQRRSLAALLALRLPDYMQPRYLEVVTAFPRTTSGKIDKKALPEPRHALEISSIPYVAPETALEVAVADIWRKQLNTDQISIDSDFFRDIRGNSLLAAHVVTDMRSVLKTVQISVRHIYDLRTIRNVARHLQALGISAEPAEARADRASNSTPSSGMHVNFATRWLCVSLQMLSLITYYAVVSAPLVFTVLVGSRFYAGQLSLSHSTELLTIAGFATWPVWLLISISVKWIAIGRYRAGQYPVWGFYYFRWWLANRFQSLGWPEMFACTPLMSLYYRAMGAQIGKNCVIGTSHCSAFDLISIGDGASVGVDSQLLGYRVENGWLILDHIEIGAGCFIGMHTAVGLGVRMRDRSAVDDDSLLPDRFILDIGEQVAGSPPVGAPVSRPQLTSSSPNPKSFLFGWIHLMLIYLMGYFLIASILPSVALVVYALNRWGFVAAIVATYIAMPLATIWYVALTAAVKRGLIGTVRPGVFPIASARYLKYWFVHYLMRNTRQLLLPLYATIFLPSFLRLLGAKIGSNVEISTITNVIPDLIEIEDGCFLADACIIGGHRIYGGFVELQANKIGRRTFIGNSALVPGGINIGTDSLIGVMSRPPQEFGQTPDRTRWLGSPSFEVPKANNDNCFIDSQTYAPTRRVKLYRAFWDTIRILLPSFMAATDFLTFTIVVFLFDHFISIWAAIVAAPILALYLSLTTITWVARIKSIIVGRFEPTVKPLWSSYVWLNEVVNGVYESAAAAALAPLMGTPIISVYLRKMGCRIGRWVFLETTLFSEFDLVEIGDYAALNLGCTVQTHLFEDRVMKADRLKIGAGCSVGNMSIVLYGTEMQNGSTLAPLSVLMKGEVLPPDTRWYGIPSEPDPSKAVAVLANYTTQPSVASLSPVMSQEAPAP